MSEPLSVPFHKHSLKPSDAEAIVDVLSSPILTSGNVGKTVEKQLEEYFNVDRAFLTNSWTNGAIATLLAMGIGPGDEVIVPAMTFIATANVVQLVGATPIFVDVDPGSLMPDYQAITDAISDRTRAIIIVHLYGRMYDVQGLRRQIKPHGDIRIIEDCAHAFEAEYLGDKPGRHSDAAIFSFYATKNITCGEGGCVITNDASLQSMLEKTRLHGMSAGASDRYRQGKYQPWDMTTLGTKANLPDILAALLPAQIQKVDEVWTRREQVALNYRSGLADLGVRVQKEDENVRHARHLMPVWVDPERRADVIAFMNEKNIGVTINYTAVTDTSYYREKLNRDSSCYVNSRLWGEGTISLPMYPDLSSEQIDYVVTSLGEALQNNEASV